MSEYWKSVPRKFCDFCKCWITDNKPSVDFHERGKRHQENVQRRLKEVRKKSYEQGIAQDQIDKEMEKMEKAALEAFKKDLAGNPELAKQYGVSLEPKPKSETVAKNCDDAESVKKDKESSSQKEWLEAKSPEGYSYYWSTVTGESNWEAPEQFISIEEQEAEKKKEEETSSEQTAENQSVGETVGDSTHEEKQTRDPKCSSRSAFGVWSVVKEESRPEIYDEFSQAPVPDEIPMPDEIPSPQEIPLPKPTEPKFKEKTVRSLGSSDSGPTTFKKRKIASGARNVRKRGDDD